MTNGPSQWTGRPPLHHARVGLASATVQGQILAIGGFEPDGPIFKFVEARGRTGDRTWHDLAALPTRRANLSAADLDGFVYAVGGIPDQDHISDAVDRYNPDTNTWEPSPKLPVAREGAGVVGLDGMLYVAGGATPSTGTADQLTDSMITYNPKHMSWTPVTSMPTRRTRFRLVAARGHLYAIGGFSEAHQALATVERYDPGSHTWDQVASMHHARALPGAVVIRAGQRRYIVVVAGGEGQPGTPTFKRLRTTEVYDLDTDRWHVWKTTAQWWRSGAAFRPMAVRPPPRWTPLPSPTTTLASTEPSHRQGLGQLSHADSRCQPLLQPPPACRPVQRLVRTW